MRGWAARGGVHPGHPTGPDPPPLSQTIASIQTDTFLVAWIISCTLGQGANGICVFWDYLSSRPLLMYSEFAGRSTDSTPSESLWNVCGWWQQEQALDSPASSTQTRMGRGGAGRRAGREVYADYSSAHHMGWVNSNLFFCLCTKDSFLVGFLSNDLELGFTASAFPLSDVTWFHHTACKYCNIRQRILWCNTSRSVPKLKHQFSRCISPVW